MVSSTDDKTLKTKGKFMLIKLKENITKAKTVDECYDLIYQAYYDTQYSNEKINVKDSLNSIKEGLLKNTNKDIVLLTLLKIHTDEDLADPLRTYDNPFDIEFFQKINKSQEKLVKNFCDELLYDSFITYPNASKDRRRIIKNNLTHLKRTIENNLKFEDKNTEENFSNLYLKRIKELYALCVFIDNVEYTKQNKKDKK